MVFSSITFLFAFLPSVLFTYFVAHSRNTRNIVLFAFSILFYAWSGLRFLPLILYSTISNYILGRLISKKTSKKKYWMMIAVISNIGILFIFKYAGFFSESLNFLFPSIVPVQIALPIGISFYTFQGLSYVIDVYRGDVECQTNFLHVALYIMLFPQLVAGPIVRYSTVAEELQYRHESLDDVSTGLQRFFYGLGKKVLIANHMGLISDSVFTQNEQLLSTGTAWLGVIAYSAQLYFDFSGYSDMAIGLGRIFGFHFLENFNYPYVSRSITEFWRRWHISLSSWFRDYLYIPLGGNHGPRWKHIQNLLIVWTLTGIWHGAAWNFIFWGLYYGGLLIAEKYLWGRILPKLPRILQHTYALFFIFIGWLLFRSSGWNQILQLLTAMFGHAQEGLWNHQATYLILQYRHEWIIALLFCLPVYPWFKNILCSKLGRFSNISILAEMFLSLAIGFLSMMQLLASGFNPFIYFQF